MTALVSGVAASSAKMRLLTGCAIAGAAALHICATLGSRHASGAEVALSLVMALVPLSGMAALICILERSERGQRICRVAAAVTLQLLAAAMITAALPYVEAIGEIFAAHQLLILVAVLMIAFLAAIVPAAISQLSGLPFERSARMVVMTVFMWLLMVFVADLRFSATTGLAASAVSFAAWRSRRRAAP